MIATVYIILMALVFALIFFRHCYLVRVKLFGLIKAKHGDEWKNFISDTGWYSPSWTSLYGTKAFHDFIWKSNVDYGDDDINILRKKIKSIIWQLPAFILIVIFLTISLIILGVLT